jgi:hypothetical protein
METITLQVAEKDKALLLEALKKFNVKIIKTPIEIPTEELISKINKSIKPGKKPTMDEIVALSRPGR